MCKIRLKLVCHFSRLTGNSIPDAIVYIGYEAYARTYIFYLTYYEAYSGWIK